MGGLFVFSFILVTISLLRTHRRSLMEDVYKRQGDIRLPLFQWMREGYLGYKKFHMRADDTADLVLMRAAETVSYTHLVG